MGRWAMVMAAIVTAVIPFQAEARGPGAGAGAEQWADANWIVGRGPQPTYYFAMGIRFVDDSGLRSIGVVGKGSCNTQKGNGWTMMMCSASGRGHEVDLDDLEFDPALRSARLHLKARGQEHNISWIGRGDAPAAGEGADVSTCGVRAYGGAGRGARAKGKVLGLKLDTRTVRDGFAFLDYFAGAAVYTDCRVNPDGSVTVTRELRIKF